MIIKTEQDKKFAESRFMKLQNKLKDKYSPAEWRFAWLLNNARIFFNRERANITMNTHWCYFDFFIPVLNLYIEIDGPEHEIPTKKSLDLEKTKIAESKDELNFVIRFTNEEVRNLNKVDYILLLSKILDTDKAKGNLVFITQWLKRQIRDYDLMKRNRTKYLGEVMLQTAFMYDREVNTIMRFETAFDLHNYTRLKCKSLAHRLQTDKVMKWKEGRFAFDLDIRGLFKKMDYIWSEELPYDDITLMEVPPIRQILQECLDLVYNGEVKPYSKNGIRQPSLFELA